MTGLLSGRPLSVGGGKDEIGDFTGKNKGAPGLGRAFGI